MRRAFARVAVSIIALMFCVVPVAAESAADLLRKHGLIGTRAMDCAKAPSREHPYIVYRIESDGTVKSDIMVTRSKVVATMTVLSVEEIELNLLRITQTSGNGADIRVEFDLRVDGNRVRSFRSVTSDGRTFIEAGRLIKDNKETDWLTKCPSSG